MAGFRTWLRSYVLNLIRPSESRIHLERHQDRNDYVSIKDLNISAPIFVSHDGIDIELPPVNLSPHSAPSQYIMEPPYDHHTIQAPTHSGLSQPVATISLDIQPSSPTSGAPKVEGMHSPCEDGEDPDIHKSYIPATATLLPQHNSKRFSFLRDFGSSSGQHNTVTISRPHTSWESSSLETSGPTRRYSVMARRRSRKIEGANELSRTTSNTSKRASMMQGMSIMSGMSGMSGLGCISGVSGMSHMHGMSDGKEYSGLSAMEWEDRRFSRGFGGGMTWGLDTFQVPMSTNAPARI